ncbi:hypothetical protein RSAG8_08838, partial [Rhizoctonia solani AG-8 WAC10335]
MYSRLGLLAVIACVTRAAPVTDIPVSLLTDAQINLVRTRMIESSQASWELGTSTQALLEHDYSPLSIYGSLALAIPNPINASLTLVRYTRSPTGLSKHGTLC